MPLGSVRLAIAVGIDAILQFFVSFIDFIPSILAGVVLGIEQMIMGGGKAIQAFIEVTGCTVQVAFGSRGVSLLELPIPFLNIH